MKIGVSYKLYKVNVSNLDGKTIHLLLGNESFDYLRKIASPGYHVVSLVQPEQVIVDCLDTDCLEDLFKKETWL